MQNFKIGKWANKIISSQNSDGSWGYFHTLCANSRQPITTEQALRRLEILGFSIEDACIERAVEYMDNCLIGNCDIPDRQEKSCDWKVFRDLMLATWIRRFTCENTAANRIASLWGNIVKQAFSNGEYSHQAYIKGYQSIFGKRPHGGRLVDFVNFYHISLLRGELDERTEKLVFDYILNHKEGIYYIYENQLTILPRDFCSKETSRYLGAIELLCGYKENTHKLAFVAEWLFKQRLQHNGFWDMGVVAKDGVYFPLSDRWDETARIKDCTDRIEKILRNIVCTMYYNN